MFRYERKLDEAENIANNCGGRVEVIANGRHIYPAEILTAQKRRLEVYIEVRDFNGNLVSRIEV
jgi:hypothetical protein